MLVLTLIAILFFTLYISFVDRVFAFVTWWDITIASTSLIIISSSTSRA
jgi:hypothetical protein